LYIYIANYESAGKMWPQVFEYMMAALFVSQVTTIGVISLKYGYELTPDDSHGHVRILLF